MHPLRIIRLVNTAATGRASIADLRELSSYSLRQLLTARRRALADTRHRADIAIPTARLIRALHALLHAFLSHPTASHAPTTHAMP